jgi:hypothetical protein
MNLAYARSCSYAGGGIVVGLAVGKLGFHGEIGLGASGAIPSRASLTGSKPGVGGRLGGSGSAEV